MTLRSGLLERSAHAAITFPDAGTSHTTSIRSGWLFAGLLLLGIAALVVVLYRRRLRTTRVPVSDTAPEPLRRTMT